MHDALHVHHSEWCMSFMLPDRAHTSISSPQFPITLMLACTAIFLLSSPAGQTYIQLHGRQSVHATALQSKVYPTHHARRAMLQ